MKNSSELNKILGNKSSFIMLIVYYCVNIRFSKATFMLLV